MQAPIVYLHQGDAPYLPYTFWHNRRANPQAPIYLLGDAPNRHYRDILHWEPLSAYFSKAQAFEKEYLHLSTLGYAFELFCLQRWFVLLEFMEKKGFQHLIHLDSDVLCYRPLNDLWPQLGAAPLAHTHISGHTAFVNGREALEHFVGYIQQMYQPENHHTLQGWQYQIGSEKAGGVSDMNFWLNYPQTYPQNTLDLARGLPDESFADVALNASFGGFQVEHQQKKLRWQEGRPRAQQNHRWVAMNTLHFQGSSKAYLYPMTTFRGPGFRAYVARKRARFQFFRGLRALKRKAGL